MNIKSIVMKEIWQLIISDYHRYGGSVNGIGG